MCSSDLEGACAMKGRETRPFEIVSSFEPCGDQPEAIRALARGLNGNRRHQTLLGVTGSGKTFTVANVIAEVNRPTLLISHNKTWLPGGLPFRTPYDSRM